MNPQVFNFFYDMFCGNQVRSYRVLKSRDGSPYPKCCSCKFVFSLNDITHKNYTFPSVIRNNHGYGPY